MSIKRVLSIFSAAIFSLITPLALAGAASAASTTIYNNIPSPQPGNVSSLGYEATSTSEFGGQVSFAGTARSNPKVTVLMSSWGCQAGHWTSEDCLTTPGATFSHPITLNIYNVGAGNSVGSLVKSTTQTFNIPYRPSASATCGDGRWYDGSTCFNGFATPISFDLNGQSVTLPNNAIISLAYNTTHYGANPIGTSACSVTPQGCGYDSLNVGLSGSPSVGTLPVPNDAYYNTSFAPNYCDGGTGGVGVFRLDSGCWAGFQPALKVEVPLPSGDDCKNNGWKTLTDDNGRPFKNQGDCVSFFATKGKNKANG